MEKNEHFNIDGFIINGKSIQPSSPRKRVRFDDENLKELAENKIVRNMDKLIDVSSLPLRVERKVGLEFSIVKHENSKPKLNEKKISIHSKPVDAVRLASKLKKLEKLQKEEKEYLRYNLNPKGIILDSKLISENWGNFQYSIKKKPNLNANYPRVPVKRKPIPCYPKVHINKGTTDFKSIWKY